MQPKNDQVDQTLFPVTYERYGQSNWTQFHSLAFAKSHTTAPIVISEIARAVIAFPFGFSRGENGRMPTALLGIEQANNLYISPEGAWYGRYLPAFFRAYPFCVLPDAEGNEVLCFDESSGLLNNSGEGWAFFEDEKTPSVRIKETIEFLDDLTKAHKLTKTLCEQIQDLDLLVPWELSVINKEGGKEIINILDRIDEEALRKLNADKLKELQDSGAIALVYSHLLSLQNMELLERLITFQHGEQKSDLGFTLGDESSGELQFDL